MFTKFGNHWTNPHIFIKYLLWPQLKGDHTKGDLFVLKEVTWADNGGRSWQNFKAGKLSIGQPPRGTEIVTHKLPQKPLKVGLMTLGQCSPCPVNLPLFLCALKELSAEMWVIWVFFKKLSWHHCQINHLQIQHLPVTLKPRDPVLRAVLQIFLMLPVCQVLLESRGSAPLPSQAPPSLG